jgi:hypothetical protein
MLQKMPQSMICTKRAIREILPVCFLFSIISNKKNVPQNLNVAQNEQDVIKKLAESPHQLYKTPETNEQ